MHEGIRREESKGYKGKTVRRQSNVENRKETKKNEPLGYESNIEVAVVLLFVVTWTPFISTFRVVAASNGRTTIDKWGGWIAATFDAHVSSRRGDRIHRRIRYSWKTFQVRLGDDWRELPACNSRKRVQSSSSRHQTTFELRYIRRTMMRNLWEQSLGDRDPAKFGLFDFALEEISIKFRTTKLEKTTWRYYNHDW